MSISHPGETFAVWQWWSHARSKVPLGKEALRINMDETSVSLYQGAAKGTIIANKRGGGGAGVIQAYAITR